MRILIDFIALLLLYVFVFCRKWKSEGRYKLFVNTLIYVYISVVLFVTLMPIITSLPFIFDHPYGTITLIPFIDVMKCRPNCRIQVILNVIMMIPFGFLLPLSDKKNNFWKVLLYTFLFSLAIEAVQPLIHGDRVADITDLITNTCGGVIGYICYLVIRPVVAKILKGMRRTSEMSL